jgi:hypothetical protein
MDMSVLLSQPRQLLSAGSNNHSQTIPRKTATTRQAVLHKIQQTGKQKCV